MMRGTGAWLVLLLALGGAGTLAWAEEGHGGQGHEEHGDRGEHDEHDEHGAIALDETQRAAGGITMEVAGPGEVRQGLKLLGEVRLDETRIVHVVPRVAGIAARVVRQAGDRVEEGDLLAVIQSPELGEAKIAYVSALLEDELARLELDRQTVIAANTTRMLEVLAGEPTLPEARRRLRDLEIGEDKGKLLEAYSRLAFSRSNLAREKDLVRQQISSNQAYQEALRDFEVAEAQYGATEEAIRFDYKLALARVDRTVKVADNALHNARRRLLLYGVAAQDVESLGQEHHHEDGHAGHGHVHPEGEAAAGVPRTVTDLDQHIAELSLRSPLKGQVLRRHMAPGERVTPERDAFLIGDLSRVWVDLAIYPEDLDRVRAGQAVEVRSRRAGLTALGRVEFVQPILSEDVRTGFCRVVLENSAGAWRPGLFVEATVFMEGGPAKVRVRRSAVIRRGEESLAFVQEDGKFESRELTLGRADDQFVEVLGGIRAGETYAATGAFVLKAELARESLGESGHHH